jgi:hypothetical protein
MPTYRGTHGTTQLSAASILLDGFRIPMVGRIGRGAYFWQYYNDSTSARALAKGWFDSQVRRGAFKEKDPKLAVLDVSFDVDDESFFDCTGEVLEEATAMLRKLNTWSDEEIGSTYETIIARVERNLGRPVLLARATVSPPKMAFKENKVMPHPAVLVVRDKSVKIAKQLVVDF